MFARELRVVDTVLLSPYLQRVLGALYANGIASSSADTKAFVPKTRPSVSTRNRLILRTGTFVWAAYLMRGRPSIHLASP